MNKPLHFEPAITRTIANELVPIIALSKPKINPDVVYEPQVVQKMPLNWEYIGIPKPFETGDWIGQRSNECVVETRNHRRYLARIYSISENGKRIDKWYTSDGNMLDSENVLRYLELD